MILPLFDPGYCKTKIFSIHRFPSKQCQMVITTTLKDQSHNEINHVSSVSEVQRTTIYLHSSNFAKSR